MVFKLNISNKGKAWKVESTAESIIGKKISDEIEGSELDDKLSGYTLKITGGTDNAGFAHKSDIQGPELKRIILTKGWGMHKKPRRAGKKKVQTPHGLRIRKTVRGTQLSEKSTQINMIVIKEGSKKLSELFPEQNKPKEKPTPAETPKEESAPIKPESSIEIKEKVKEEIKEEIKEDIPKSPETDNPKSIDVAAEKVAEEVTDEIKDTVEEITKKEESKK